MWTIRPELVGDVRAVRRVHEAAFAPSRDEADLVDALRAAGDSVPDLCLVAVIDDLVVGHIMFSLATLDSGWPVLALAPMGVLPERQHAGIGAALVREGLARASQTEFPLVVVLGHPGYYPRFGFEPAVPLGVIAPFPVPSAAWMVFRLPGYTADVRGRVIYPDAFDAVT